MSSRNFVESAGHAVLFAAITVLAGGSWFLSNGATHRLEQAQARNDAAQILGQQVAALRIAFLQAELGVRSFVVTKQPGFLKSYNGVAKLIPIAMEKLRDDTAGTPEAAFVAALEPLIADRLESLRQFTTLDMARPGAMVSVRRHVEASARAAEAVVAVLAELEKRGIAEQALARAEMALNLRASIVGTTLQGVISLSVASFIFCMLLRQSRCRRKAEAEVAKTGGLMELVFKSTAEGIIVADSHGRALVFNPAADRMLGGRPPQAETGRWEELQGLFHTDGRPLSVREMPLVRALAGQSTEKFEVCLKTGPDGQRRFLTMTGAPLFEEGLRLRGGVIVISETTARHQADNEIRRLNQDLQASVAEMMTVNRELESFASSVSHGLRAPLRAINGFARMLETKGAAQDKEQLRLLGVISINAERMGRLIDDLLAYVDLLRRPLRAGRVEMELLARAAFDEIQRADAGCCAELKLGPLPDARADIELARELWLNLLDNAVKFSRRGPKPEIQVGSVGGNGKTVYFVRDNGVGFKMRYAHRLFGVFQRLHGTDEFEGAGVGLAIARRIVERHGGLIWAKAEEGRGATFYFTLPLVEETEDHARR